MLKGFVPRLGLRGVAIGALGVASQLTSADPARAAGRLLPEKNSSIRIARIRAAEARSADWKTAWLSMRVDGGPGKFAIVLPAPDGTSVARSIDAFFDALDHSTAPRIRPPDAAPACGKTEKSSIDDLSEDRNPSIGAESAIVLDTVGDVEAYAESSGLGFSSDDFDALSESSSTMRFVVLVYSSAKATAESQTVRLSFPSATTPLNLALAKSNASVPDVTLYEIGEGRAHMNEAEELSTAEVGAIWKLNTATTTYREDRRSLLVDKQGGAWLLESTGSAPLFGWAMLPNDGGTVPPAAKTYLDYGAADGASMPAADGCLSAVYEAIDDGKLGARVSRACAGDKLVDVGTVACSEAPKAGEIASVGLRCGDADDFAFALGGMRADLVKVTRQASVVAAASASTLELSFTSGSSVSVGFPASELDASGCVLGNAGASGTGGFSGGWNGGSGGGGYGGDGGYGGYGAYGGDDPGYPEDPEPEPNVQVDVSCWGSSDSSGGDDSCSGDSSDSSDSEGDSCDSDSSDSSGDGDTCSGDSSDSGSDGETCSGDSGSSGGDGETCSGDSGSSSGGDTCGGSSSSGSSGGDCTTARIRPRKVRVSALTLLIAALAFPLRRRARRARRAV